jgi:hypothetical protein
VAGYNRAAVEQNFRCGNALMRAPDSEGAKPDNALAELEAARNLLAQLSDDEPLDALREITTWLSSVRDGVALRPERRAAIVLLLDDAAQLLQAKLLRQYLAGFNTQDPQQIQFWQGMQDFMAGLANAYAACVDAYLQPGKKPLNFKSHLPLFLVRLLRASAAQMKLSLMRYQEVEPAVWRRMYLHYRLAKTHLLSNNMVMAYPADTTHISTQKELLRALVVYVSSPATLTPAQIEASFQVAFQLVNFFEIRETRDPGCAYLIDLAQAAPPQRMFSDLQITQDTRFFGAIKAAPKVQELMDQYRNGGSEPGVSGNSNPGTSISVLRHLHTQWAKEPPRRLRERRDIETDIAVVHGFQAICRLVEDADASLLPAAARQSQPSQPRAATPLTRQDMPCLAEIWDVLDVSTKGVGGVLPDPGDTRVKIGTLWGIKAKSCDVWWAGLIRRRQTDGAGQANVGIEILAKQPVAISLCPVQPRQNRVHRIFGRLPEAATEALPGILLADGKKSSLGLLLEAGKFVLGQKYEVIVDGQSGTIQLTGLLAEGDDYQQVSFQWLAAAAS